MNRSYRVKPPVNIKYEGVPDEDAQRQVDDVFDFLFDKITQEYRQEQHSYHFVQEGDMFVELPVSTAHENYPLTKHIKLIYADE